MKQLLLISLTFFTAIANAEITIVLPEEWKLSGTVIYADGKKVGEVTSKNSWPHTNGKEFISSFRKGFVDDPRTTEFISSGDSNGIYWICRNAEYWDGKGSSGYWFVRRFWVNGPILTLYSYESCTENFDEALKVAATIKEK